MDYFPGHSWPRGVGFMLEARVCNLGMGIEVVLNRQINNQEVISYSI
jgi:hypothetical protein